MNRVHKTTVGFILAQMVVLPFLDLKGLSYSALVTAVFLIILTGVQFLRELKAYYFALLGFGVMAFLDIFKHNALFNTTYYPHPNYDWAVYWTYIALALFLIGYSMPVRTARPKNREFSVRKFAAFGLPVSTAFLAVYVIYLNVVEAHTTMSSVLLLVSFFPKAVAILLFYLAVKRRSWWYFILCVVFMAFAFTEVSRRIYITIFIMCLSVVYAYLYERHGKIPVRHRALGFLSFLVIFFFMNYLRADMDTGEDFKEDDKIGNTINYMRNLTALDTYDNTAFILTKFPQKFHYYNGETYGALFVQFMPRSLWSGKPVGLGGPLGLMRYQGTQNFTKEKWLVRARGVSFSPGFVGEAYANFGKTGIVIMSLIFGWATKYFDRKVHPKRVLKDCRQLANVAFYASFFLLLRGDMVMAMYFSLLFYLFLRVWFVLLK